jgi:hypothetical protein
MLLDEQRPWQSITWIIVVLAMALGATGRQRITGFSDPAAKSQAEIEAVFKSIPSSEEARKHHRFLTAEPHPAGSERNNLLAGYISDLWKQHGWEDVTIRRYDVLNTFPREVSVEMITPVRYKAGLREASYDLDPDTKNPQVQSAYTGLSASGEVTAPVVYAHSGNPEDYDLLRKHGIDVKGKIVLVRYSNPYSYRGFKAFTAEREGAAAMIIYSDPREDGFKRGKVFPDGPWGPESHIQRGAITYDFIVPGDPLTPGVYHSMYDNFYWMNQFGDPGYRYHTLMSKLWGVLALRLANAGILPFDFAFYADNIKQFVEELQKNKEARRHFDFRPLLARITQFEAEGRALNQAIVRLLAAREVDDVSSQRINRDLMQVEGNWLNSDGIPGRPWFKHTLYAARYTYAHLELPGLTEAIERGDWKAAGEQGRILENALAKNVALLSSIRGEIAR